MTETVLIFRQIVIMFFLMLVGYVAYKKKIIDDEGTRQITDVLLYVCNPALMIAALDVPFQASALLDGGLAILTSAVLMAVTILVSRLLVKKDRKLEQFGVIFCNASFIAIPLVRSVMGDADLFYLTMYLVISPLLVWTYGIYLVSGRREAITVKKMILNPAAVSFVIGLALFFIPAELPDVAADSLNMLGECNTPLGMLVLGAYLAKSDLKEIVTNKAGYYVSFCRLIAAPLVNFAVLSLLPDSMYDLKMTLFIACSTPVGVLLGMMSQKHGADYAYGARIICLSTILSLITMPLLIMAAAWVWN